MRCFSGVSSVAVVADSGKSSAAAAAVVRLGGWREQEDGRCGHWAPWGLKVDLGWTRVPPAVHLGVGERIWRVWRAF